MSEGDRETRSGGARLRERPMRGAVAAVLALQLAAGLLLVGTDRGDERAPAAVASDTGAVAAPTEDAARLAPPAEQAATTPAPAPVEPAAAPTPEETAAAADTPPPAATDTPPTAGDPAPLVVPEPGAPPAAEPRTAAAAPGLAFAASAPATTESERTFAREFPEHAAARQRPDVPSSYHWAVIIGVNDYMGRTTSTIGSVGDALTLRDTLYRNGWRGDQVLTLTDHAATHDRIIRAIEWLMRSTDENSTVIFSFSGHMRHNSGVTAVWPADNQFIWANDLGRMLGAVRADRLWVSLQGCHAAGLAAPGVEGPGRLATYASRVEDKAYEDPSTRHSVMGYYLFAEGLRDGRGDQAGNGDGRTSAQEAFAWAAPRATSRTNGQQPYGAQRPVVVDGLGGREFPLAVTGAPPPPDRPSAGAPRGGAPDGDEEPRRRGLLNLPPLRLPPLGGD